jgi:hypothetical protein
MTKSELLTKLFENFRPMMLKALSEAKVGAILGMSDEELMITMEAVSVLNLESEIFKPQEPEREEGEFWLLKWNADSRCPEPIGRFLSRTCALDLAKALNASDVAQMARNSQQFEGDLVFPYYDVASAGWAVDYAKLVGTLGADGQITPAAKKKMAKVKAAKKSKETTSQVFKPSKGKESSSRPAKKNPKKIPPAVLDPDEAVWNPRAPKPKKPSKKK